MALNVLHGLPTLPCRYKKRLPLQGTLGYFCLHQPILLFKRPVNSGGRVWFLLVLSEIFSKKLKNYSIIFPWLLFGAPDKWGKLRWQNNAGRIDTALLPIEIKYG